MISQPLTLAALLAIAGLVQADCNFENSLTEPTTEAEERPELCQPTDEDTWTFAMDISEVSVPTLNGQNAYAGVAGNKAFIVYDNDCVPKGVYSLSDHGNDCGIPYWINDIGLPYHIKINEVRMTLGGGDFTFEYSNGAYMIGENGATCEDISDDLYGEMACSATFPINGETTLVAASTGLPGVDPTSIGYVPYRYPR